MTDYETLSWLVLAGLNVVLLYVGIYFSAREGEHFFLVMAMVYSLIVLSMVFS
ncbi:hypothetical protein [Streptococcus thoraltensis]|uniref:hypothetical protein n=1 Tax=Streptococcus thoraltensis TaxID=55085 RepID=UPI001F57DF42|nr:hypothetical protein [Streptococcus thoraltensis]